MTAEALSQLKWLWYRQQHRLSDIEVFDKASRGAYGSLKLLWGLGPRHTLAWTGAIVTILMVLIGPFAQQLLLYYDCHWPLDGTEASVALSSFYEDFGSDAPTYHIVGGLASVPPAWQQAVNAGLFAPGQKIPVNCPSGNCTFQHTYATLGYCSTCSDVSNQLSIVNQTFHDGTYTSWGYNTSLPSGSFVLSGRGDGVYNWSSISVDGISSTVDIILGQAPYDAFRNAFVEDNSTCVAQEGSASWRCRGYGAAKCKLYPCVKRFAGFVKVGSLQETLLDTSDQWSSNDTVFPTILDVQCLSPQERVDLQTANYQIADGQQWLGYNWSWDTSLYDKPPKVAPFPQSLQTHGCIYGYYAIMDISLWSWMARFFDGYITSASAPGVSPQDLDGPQNLQTIFNWGNISFERVEDTFKNISESLTNVLRQSAAANNSAPAIGTVFKDQTCVRVRWPWLALPASLIIVVWIFLAATMIEQHTAKWLPSWKSSLFPILLHGTTVNSPGDENFAVQGDDLTQMRSTARNAKVQLGATGRGLGLKEC